MREKKVEEEEGNSNRTLGHRTSKVEGLSKKRRGSEGEGTSKEKKKDSVNRGKRFYLLKGITDINNENKKKEDIEKQK